jgi:hypothetical protein
MHAEPPVCTGERQQVVIKTSTVDKVGEMKPDDRKRCDAAQSIQRFDSSFPDRRQGLIHKPCVPCIVHLTQQRNRGAVQSTDVLPDFLHAPCAHYAQPGQASPSNDDVVS